jgi:hypothetical protein
MASRSLSFFATPEEQRAWIARVLQRVGVWCLVDSAGSRSLLSLKRDDVDRLLLSGREYGVRLFLGHQDLAAPQIRQEPHGLAILMAESLAIQLIPCMRSDTVLTEGPLAVLPQINYVEKNLDSHGLLSWFRELARDLRRALQPVQVTVRTAREGSPPAMVKGRHTVSPAALALHKSGVKFKQFANSRIELLVSEV